MNILVIGGVAAGMSTASKLRRLDPKAVITVLEKGGDVSYGACGMPYYLSDIIPKESSLIAKTIETFKAEDIDVRLYHEAVMLDVKNKRVIAENPEKGQLAFDYDKLIIATGASAIRLPIENRHLQGIHVLNSLEDARRLKVALNHEHVKHVAVIGGGYIGLETVENLIHLGKEVTLIERESRVLSVFEPFISATVQKSLEDQGLNLRFEETVQGYQGRGVVSQVMTDKGSYAVDLVIEAVGIKPNTAFLNNTDIKRLKNGAIVTDRFMRTNLPDIYAAGDCASYQHRLNHNAQAYMPLGTHANKAGRIIAEHIAGNNIPFDGVIGSAVLKVFDLEIARTGLSLEEASAHHDAGHVTITAKDKAGYYPKALPIEVMIIYDKQHGTLLGAQLVGAGVAHRINIMATAISAGMTAQAFSGLDLAYSPPFSPVYDPLQIATNQIKCHH